MIIITTNLSFIIFNVKKHPIDLFLLAFLSLLLPFLAPIVPCVFLFVPLIHLILVFPRLQMLFPLLLPIQLLHTQLA